MLWGLKRVFMYGGCLSEGNLADSTHGPLEVLVMTKAHGQLMVFVQSVMYPDGSSHELAEYLTDEELKRIDALLRRE